jgi:hypothetical protein
MALTDQLLAGPSHQRQQLRTIATAIGSVLLILFILILIIIVVPVLGTESGLSLLHSGRESPLRTRG